ncbi:MFS transporter [Streptomyces mexicanus]|uniref:MFS transporter n=1 Tax=Streptomyces mexicanus TaxID=178566 RepID=A0A7X1I0C5_9ACTN|nr:MFS transporter [Streptomyces mexicanus]
MHVTGPTGLRKVLTDRNSGLYLSGVVVSGFGSTAMSLVAGMWVKELTGSSSVAALATFCVWLPTLFGPAVGVVADRTQRRTLLIATNVAMAVLLLPLLAVRSADGLWILFAVMIVYGISTVLQDAAEAALVTAAVPAELRGDFNGLRMTANEGMKLVAPLAGAALFAARGGFSVALLDAATFLAAAAAFACIRVSEPPVGRPGRESWAAQTVEGARYLWRHPLLRRLVLAGGSVMLLSGLNAAAVYAVVDSGLHRDAAFVGVLYTFQGIGSMLGGLTAGALMRRMSEPAFSAAGIAVFSLGVVLRATSSTGLALAGSVLIGVGLPCGLISALTAVQRETPENLLGRVAATANTFLFGPSVVAQGVGAGLVAVVDHRLLLGAVGAGGVVTTVWCLAGSRRQPLRPAVPEEDVRQASASPSDG